MCMKTRSEKKTLNGLYCGKCGSLQFSTTLGVVCANGHSGAQSVGPEEAREIRGRVSNRFDTSEEDLKKEADQAREKGDQESAKQKVVEKKKKIEEISQELKDQLQPPDDPFDFQTAHKSRTAKLRRDMDAIVKVTFVNDMEETWKRLKVGLRIGESRSDHGTLQIALDRAETNSHNAYRLYLTAKVEYERWERENDSIFAAMWSAATRSLQGEKDSGIRAKQITDADVKSRCAALFPDEYKAQEVRRAKVKATVDALSDLAAMWKSRCQTLQTMMNKLRG